MRIEQLEKITALLEQINSILNESDSYHIRDAVIANLEDPDMIDYVTEFLIRMDVNTDAAAEVLAIVAEAQECARGEGDVEESEEE